MNYFSFPLEVDSLMYTVRKTLHRWCLTRFKYSSGSEYVRIPNITGFWIYLGSEYIWARQSSEYTWIEHA